MDKLGSEPWWRPCVQPRPSALTVPVLLCPDVSLGLLTRGFLELLLAAPDGSLDLRQVTTHLRTRKRRVYDITNVLDGIDLIQKESANRVKWT